MHRANPMLRLGLAMLAVTPAWAAEVTLQVEADRGEIYLGESVTLTVRVAGSDTAQPDLTAVTNGTVRALGSRSESRYSIVIVNGRMQKQGFSGRIYAYELTPATAGPFQAGPVRLEVEGRTLADPGPSINVLGIEEQSRVQVRVFPSREAVLVDERFDITFSIAVERLKGRFSETDPLDPGDPPALEVPFLEAAPIQGLEGPNIEDVLRRHLVNRADAPGFLLNRYTVRSDPFQSFLNFQFDDPTREQRARFMFDRRPLEQDGRSCFEYVLTLSYTAKEEGSYTFGPALFKGKAVVAADAAGRAVGRPVFAVGPACTVRVVPPPEEGRPASFIGVIGSNLTVRSALDTQTCKVGDPLTLTVAVSGDANLQNAYPPALSEQPGLTGDFRVYDDTVKVSLQNGVRQFVYTVRPIRSGTFEFPPVAVSFFDAARRAYRTEQSLPIPLRVNAAAELATDMILATATNGAPATRDADVAAALTPAPLDVDPAGAGAQDVFRWRRNALVAAAGPLAYGLAVRVAAWRRSAPRRALRHRKRNAWRRCRAALRAAENRAAADPREATHLLCRALRSYLAVRFDRAETTLMPDSARRLLDAEPLPAEWRAEVCDLIERNFSAAYADEARPADAVAADCRRAAQAVRQLEAQACARRGRQAGSV